MDDSSRKETKVYTALMYDVRQYDNGNGIGLWGNQGREKTYNKLARDIQV